MMANKKQTQKKTHTHKSACCSLRIPSLKTSFNIIKEVKIIGLVFVRGPIIHCPIWDTFVFKKGVSNNYNFYCNKL